MKESDWIYVGDGVYARSDGYQMVIKTTGDPICLDNSTWFSLSRLHDAWMKEDEPQGDNGFPDHYFEFMPLKVPDPERGVWFEMKEVRNDGDEIKELEGDDESSCLVGR